MLLVTIDTLRPDALGFVAGRNATPAIDRLARSGVAFPGAVSPVPLTLPAHASILTGFNPRRHGVRDNGQPLPARPPTLAERLRARGLRTAAFVSGFPLQRMFGLDRGFERYDDDLPSGREGWVERRADETTRRALAYLTSTRGPFFLWVHYYDPHDPYEPPRPFFRGADDRGRYDGEVAFVDHYVGELLAGARARDPRLLTVLAADHGEALGEHDEVTHGYYVYDSTILVPLVFAWEERLSPATSPRPARLVDVAPTVLDLLDLPPLPDTDGVSLRPLLEGRDQPLPPAYVETMLPWTYFGWAPLGALREQDLKLIQAPRSELYDLKADPGETRPLAESHPGAARLRTALRAVEAKGSMHATAVVDPEALERLRALGYVGSGAGAGQEPPPNLADPKDRIALRRKLADAEALLRDGDMARALALFEAVRREDPPNRAATLRAGVTLLKMGRAAEAAERLREAVRLDPERAEARFALGDALVRAGRTAEAVDHWMELTRLQPRRLEGWFNLGLALLNAGKPVPAIEALRSASRLKPDDSRVTVVLARAEFAAGRHADAVAHLREVARGQGTRFEAPALLGLALARRGQQREALTWLARSTRAETEHADGRWEMARILARRGDAAGARAALQEALAARPQLRERVTSDPLLAPLNP